MFARDLVSEIIPAIHASDKASNALNWMDVFRVSHLPIVDDNHYIGLISDSDIFDMNEPSISVIEHQRSLARPFVYDYQHIYEIIEDVTKNKLSLIPVITEDEEYLGIIRGTDLANNFLQILAPGSPGGIIILETKTNDYSMSEISQIIESNDAKIISFFTKTSKQHDKIEITIKVNKTDIAGIIQTFERYSYNIKTILGKSVEVDTLMQDRIDAFLKFINI